MKFLIAFLLSFFSALSHVETIAATPNTPQYYCSLQCGGEYATLVSYQAVCDAWRTAKAFVPYPNGASPVVNIYNSGTPQELSTCTGWPGSGSSFTSVEMRKRLIYVCPTGQNWTLNGTTCSRPDCTAGQVRDANTGQCLAPCLAGQHRGGMDNRCICDTGADVGNDGSCCPVAGSGGGAPMQWCNVASFAQTTCDAMGPNGCDVRCNGITFQKGTGANLQLFPKLALGQSCSFTGKKAAAGIGGGGLSNDELSDIDKATKDPQKAQTPGGCLAAGMGYVTSASGTTTCVSGGDAGGVNSSKKDSTSTTGADGKVTTQDKTTSTDSGPNGTGTKQEVTTTTNPDGSVTTQRKTITYNPDGTVTTTTSGDTTTPDGTKTPGPTTDDKKSKGTYCQENPSDPVCQKASDTCADHPERASCTDMGTPPTEGDLASNSVGPSAISQVAVASNANCPAGPPLPYGLGNMSFDGICQLATGIRPVVLAMAWLAAGLILLGGFKES